ncbi:MAG TPA: S-layer homology domain-containing protein, partial [Natronincola sp.]|nr:S-layer homology domain-containing protein [Natronincola sp.]
MNMKLKKFALVLAIVLVASTFAPAFAKGPFTDVDANHWAYDSIAELAATGLIEGYPDGTFGGQNTMTRYEAAMVFARALTRLETHLSSSGLLSELDKIKAEIVEEVLAQAGGSVETTIVERVVVDGGLDEEVLARLRDAEMANEAIEGDVAYLEARLLGLVDGIRYDVNRIQEQLDAGVEPVGIEELEEMIAAKVQEVVLEAALGTKETVIV